MGAATGAMLPFRSSLSLAAAALVFVLPVVGAMLLGGARVGLIGVVLGFRRARRRVHPAVWDLGGRQRAELAGAQSLTSRSSCWSQSSYRGCSNSEPTRRGAQPTRGGSWSCRSCSSQTNRSVRCSPSSPRASGVPSVSRPLPSCCLQPGPATSRSSRPTAPSSGASHWTASCLSRVPLRRSPAASSPARCCDKYR